MGVCPWEQVVRGDLAEGHNVATMDLVSEIELLPKIGHHPNVVGFVGACVSDHPIMIFEYMDGGCLDDVLTAKRKNGSPWRPPKETSFSWCA